MVKGGIVGISGYAICVIAACFGISFIAHSAVSSMARQPEIKDNAFTVFIMGAAFCEALALIGFVVVLIG